MISYFYILYLLFSVFIKCNCVVINTKQGLLEGGIEQSRNGRPFYSFYSIPYAKPPVGDLRFEDPQSPLPWEGVRNATTFPPSCMAPDSLVKYDVSDYMSEDCLYLNLYVPEAEFEKKSKPLPVIVFVYGGRFLYGHARPIRYGPHYFMDKDVILITFQYRLGILGFLSTEDEVLPGNYGLKDFVAVLKWVQENIESFNGDKNNVTIMGGSSGGSTTAITLVSPLAQGLFHRVVTLSTATILTVKPGIPRKFINVLATKVGCPNEKDGFKNLVPCFKKLPVQDLVDCNFDVTGSLISPLNVGPVVEKEGVSGAFLTEDPVKLYQRKTDIPWLFGINSDDGGMMTIFAYFSKTKFPIDILAENFEKYLPELMEISDMVTNNKVLQKIAHVTKEHFFGDSDITTNASAFSKMTTACLFIREFKKFMNNYQGPKYAYIYDHRNEPNFDHYFGNPPYKMGVIHGDEMISLFNWTEFIPPVTEGDDLVVSTQFIDLLTNFAIFGNPNGNSQENIIWEPVTSSKKHYLRIRNGTLEMTDTFMQEDFKFLDKLDEIISGQIQKDEL